MRMLAALTLSLVLGAPVPARAQTPEPAAPLVNAEVRRIDRSAGKVTLRHEPIPNLDMSNMTMVFTATKPEILDGLKVGDRVRFSADKVKGQYIVTRIEPAP